MKNITNREMWENAAGMALDSAFFYLRNIDPDAIALENWVLEQEIVYDADYFRVIKSKVEFPNGDIGFRTFVKPCKAVAIVPYEFDKDGICQIYLVEQYRDACGQVLLEIPAGKIDDGEEPQQAVIRELMEEIGKRPQEIREICTPYLSPGYSSESIHIFLATDLEDATKEKDLHEYLNVVRCSLDDAIKMIHKGTIKDGKSIIGLMMLNLRDSNL